MNADLVNNPDFKEIVIQKKTKIVNTHPKIEISKQDKLLNSDEQPVLKTFGKDNAKILQNGRMAKKITQKELANRINESQKTINLYEQGNIVPENKILQKLRKELNVKFI